VATGHYRRGVEDQPRSPGHPEDGDRPGEPSSGSGGADPDATQGFDAAAAAAEPSEPSDSASDAAPDGNAGRGLGDDGNDGESTTRADETPPGGDLDATQEGPPLDLDATQLSPRVGPTSGGPTTSAEPNGDPDRTRTFDPDATRWVPTVDDSTAVLPSTAPDQTAVGPTIPEGWQGRATVRPGGPPPAGPPAEGQPGQSSGRAWWLPILLGIIGLLLIIGLAYGLVLATRHKNTTPPPAPSPTSVPTSVAPSTTAPSTPPSTPPSTTALTTVPSGLTTLDLQGAEDALTQSGLKFTTVPQTTTDPGQVGRVLSTDPASGTQVAPGSTVTLTYGVAPSPSPSVAPSTAGAVPSPGSS
jgi:PASTA domain